MVTLAPAEVLPGRRAEREALERLLEAVPGEQSRVVVVCGEPGVGKTGLEPAGGFGLLDVPGPSGRIEDRFRLDEDVASEFDPSAGRARARGGFTAALLELLTGGERP